MSLLPYKVTALARVDNGDLNIIPNASVTVLTSNGIYAQLYEADGTTPIGNPFNCDENGERQIYLSGGSYSISVEGGQSWEIRLSGASDIHSVETVADLRNLTGLQVGQKIQVAGYYAGSTLGVGAFTVSGDIISADNNGTVFVTTDGKRIYRDDWDNVSTVDFGLVNSADDQSARFQQAVTWAETNNKPLHAPKGSSYHVGEITSGTVDFITAGCTLNLHSSKSFIWLMDGANDPQFKKVSWVDPGARASVYGFRATNTAGLRWRACNVSGWASRVVFFEQSCSDIKVIGGRVFGCTAPDVYMAKCLDVDFIRIGLKDCTEHVIRYGCFSWDDNSLVASGNVVGCVFRNIANDPILCELNAEDVTVRDCTAINCRNLIKADGDEEPPLGFKKPRRIHVYNPTVRGTNNTYPQVAAVNLLKTEDCSVIGGHFDGGSSGNRAVQVGDNGVVMGITTIRGYVDGIVVFGSHATVNGNSGISVSTNGIRSGSTGDLSQSTISNNTIRSSARPISLDGSTQTVISANVGSGTTSGIRTTSACSDITVIGNRNAGGAANSLAGTGIVDVNNF